MRKERRRRKKKIVRENRRERERDRGDIGESEETREGKGEDKK